MKWLEYFRSADNVLVSKTLKKGVSRVAVFGIGIVGKSVVSKLLSSNISITHWYDSAIREEGHTLMGIDIYPKSLLSEHQPSHLIIASEEFASEIEKTCKELGYNGVLIRLD